MVTPAFACTGLLKPCRGFLYLESLKIRRRIQRPDTGT